jgi:hypothetical protein
MQYPKQSTTVHVENLNGELSVYDWQRKQVHNLNPTAARVWELCDGQTTPQEMAAQLHGDLTPAQAEEVVWLTLKRLEQAHLLADKVVQPAGRKVYTRREMLTKLGVAALMLPVISTIMAPSPVAAQSPGGSPIVRTANVGNVVESPFFTNYVFNEGPITDAQITACAPTTITYAWTGDPVPAGGGIMGQIALAQSPTVRANAHGLFVGGTTSPQTSADANHWTGNRPYNGVDIDAFATDWNVGVLTITLA